jgi:hypothetical protein
MGDQFVLERTRDLLGSVADVLTGAEPGPLFKHLTDHSTAATKVFRLTP